MKVLLQHGDCCSHYVCGRSARHRVETWDFPESICNPESLLDLRLNGHPIPKPHKYEGEAFLVVHGKPHVMEQQLSYDGVMCHMLHYRPMLFHLMVQIPRNSVERMNILFSKQWTAK